MNAAPELAEEQLDRILDVVAAAWTDKTKESYGTGLLVFHVYCDMNDVHEQQRCPASATLLLAFLSSCAGTYSGKALSNFAAGLRAWHLLHGHPWLITSSELQTALEGANKLAPADKKRKKRAPFLVDTLLLFLTHMNTDEPKDAAIFACLVVCFYSLSRLGEFTVKSIKTFDPKVHVTPANVTHAHDQNGLPVSSFFLPFTKCSSSGESVQCAPIDHPTNPLSWLNNHMRINNPGPKDHLFSWKHPKSGLRPLSRHEVDKRISQLLVSCAIDEEIKGHSLRIGGTLHYLLQGTPFDVVKTMGRWAGDSFTLYLRQHALILAPYLHNKPEFTRHLSNIAMPMVR